MPTKTTGEISRWSWMALASVLCALSTIACTVPDSGITPSQSTPPLSTLEAEIVVTPIETVDDEYSVYSAVIESFYITDDVEQVVVLAQTESGVGVGGSVEAMAPFLQESFGTSLGEDTFADFMQNHAENVRLERKFALPLDYALIDTAEFENLVNESGGWQTFFARYPGSSGLISFSPVGFSQTGEQALVYTAFVGDYGSGQGYYVLLTKQGGIWVVEQSAVAWLS